MVGTAKQLRLREHSLYLWIKGEDEARSGKGRWVQMAHLLHSRALVCEVVHTVPICLTTGCVEKGALFCNGPMLQVSDCGDVFGGVKVCSEVSWNCWILVEFESTQNAFNCPLFFLVFLPASSALVLVPDSTTASRSLWPGWSHGRPWSDGREPACLQQGKSRGRFWP